MKAAIVFVIVEAVFVGIAYGAPAFVHLDWWWFLDPDLKSAREFVMMPLLLSPMFAALLAVFSVLPPLGHRPAPPPPPYRRSPTDTEHRA